MKIKSRKEKTKENRMKKKENNTENLRGFNVINLSQPNTHTLTS